MSKKRLAASLLVVLFGILANILIFRYEPALSEKKVTVKVTLTSDEENYIEMVSNNTRHQWIIFKRSIDSNKPVTLYHKHTEVCVCV